MEKIEQRWLRTPQEELAGRTPAEVLGRPGLPALPSPKELAPAGLPVLALESLEALADGGSAAAREWAIGTLARRTGSLPVPALLALFGASAGDPPYGARSPA